MAKQIVDVACIGVGTAGAFAVFKLAKDNPKLKIIAFDTGVQPLKRRSGRGEGFLGAFPTSDGKLYLNDINKVSSITNKAKTDAAMKWFMKYCSNHLDLKLTEDRSPSISISKKIKKNGFDLYKNDLYQLYPKDIHTLIKNLSEYFDRNKNIVFEYNNEVLNIKKQKNQFLITTENGDFIAKKIIIGVGRTGWRWVSDLYNNFKLVKNNDFAYFGLRMELPESYMKEYNCSNCTIYNDNLEIGPLSWNGTVIPEDQVDMAIAAFRSNETRWKTDKVSFNFIGKREFKKGGWEQSDRIGQLTWTLANDRILKEKVSLLVSGKSKVSIIPEYNWLCDEIKKVGEFLPFLIEKGYFHAPSLLTKIPEIKIKKDLSTEIDGMYVAGESAGVSGILSAILTGIIASDGVIK